MKYRAFAAQAAVTTVVLAFASSATAATVDSLKKPLFFAASPATGEQQVEVAGNYGGSISAVDVTEPATFQITVDAVSPEQMDSALSAVVESAEEFFAGTDPHMSGVAVERAYRNDALLAKGPSTMRHARQFAMERGHIAAVPVAASAVVPLPASGILMICGLIGLSRLARRKT